MVAKKPVPQLTIEQRLNEAEIALTTDWHRNLSPVLKFDPDGTYKYYDISANILGSKDLRKAIQDMAMCYRETMMQKARLKLQVADIEREKPGFIKRIWSKEAKGKIVEIERAMEPLEVEYSKLQNALCRQNVENFTRLCDLVEKSYDEPTRQRLGDGLKAEAKKDAYVILGNTIRIVVECFNDAFRRFGVEEFGLPKNISDPRQKTEIG